MDRKKVNWDHVFTFYAAGLFLILTCVLGLLENRSVLAILFIILLLIGGSLFLLTGLGAYYLQDEEGFS